MTISVVMPVRDEGRSCRHHVLDCLDAMDGLDAELVVLDNRSVDGCCHGLPSEILIVRTERDEGPARLWRLGWALAQREAILWLPGVASISPDRFRGLVRAAEMIVAGVESLPEDARPRRQRLAATRGGPALVTPEARRMVERWARIRGVGWLASALAVRALPLSVSVRIGHRADADLRRPTSGGRGVRRGIADEPLASPDRRVVPLMRRGVKRLSVIITAHDEGDEVRRTVGSVRAGTRMEHEIIVVDDASTDDSCTGLEGMGVRVIRHPERVGVAYSRDAGSRAAEGDVFAYLDAHQRVDPGCLDRCAELAAEYGAIACPPCRPLHRRYPVGYGAEFRLCPERGYFSARSRIDRPRKEVSRITALRSPGYLIPRRVYDQVAWIGGLRGWGATDYSVALKAFFADVDILLVDAGATEHLFRKRIPYETSWPGVWRNHALIARVCFDDRTWERYWLPEVFRANLPEETLLELDSPAVVAERDAFRVRKVRPDREFWRGLLRRPEPCALT